MNRAPLAGIRVLDLAPLLPGAFAAMWLGDLGADVIKVESPDRASNYTRFVGDPLGGLGPYFVASNRNKCSIVLDLKQLRGQGVMLGWQSRPISALKRRSRYQRDGLAVARMSGRLPDLLLDAPSGR